MNISPVSFGSSATFSQIVNKPQAYQRKDTPVAASSLQSTPKKKPSFIKTVLKFGVAAAAIAGALALGAKHGIFTSDKIKNETLKKGLGYLQTAGEKVSEFAGPHIQKGKDFIANLGKKATDTASNIADDAGEMIERLPDSIQ
ncbi:hypothetical protein IJ182_01910 [bacterium]|nr:hypothetical protein [bacterium]